MDALSPNIIQCALCQESLRRDADNISLRLHVSHKHFAKYAPFQCSNCRLEFGDPALLEVPNLCCDKFDPEAAQQYGPRNVTQELLLTLLVQHSLERAKGINAYEAMIEKLETRLQDFDQQIEQLGLDGADSGLGADRDSNVSVTETPSRAKIRRTDSSDIDGGLPMGAEALSLTFKDTNTPFSASSVARTDCSSSSAGEGRHCTLCDELVPKSDDAFKRHLMEHLTADPESAAEHELDSERIQSFWQPFFDPHKFRCSRGNRCGFTDGRNCKSWKDRLLHVAQRHLPPLVKCGWKKCENVACTLRTDCADHCTLMGHQTEKFKSNLTSAEDRSTVADFFKDFNDEKMPKHVIEQHWCIALDDLQSLWPQQPMEQDEEEEDEENEGGDDE